MDSDKFLRKDVIRFPRGYDMVVDLRDFLQKASNNLYFPRGIDGNRIRLNYKPAKQSGLWKYRL